MGAIEPWHLVLLLVIILVLGPGKLPQVGKGIGEALREFRKATSEIQGAVRLDPPPAAPAASQAASSAPSAATPLAQGTRSQASEAPAAPVLPDASAVQVR